jgi:hypothetical protein
MPVLLSASQSSVVSNANGLASFVPSVGSFTGPLEVEIQVSAGTSAAIADVMEAFPQSNAGNFTPPDPGRWQGSIPAPRVGSPPPLRVDDQ